MSRVSIEVTADQHMQLKAAAALTGKSIKDFILDKVLPYTDEEKKALRDLEDFLKPRIDQARRGNFSDKTFKDVKREARRKVSQ